LVWAAGVPWVRAVEPKVAVVPVARAAIAREVSFDAELRPFQEVEIHPRTTGYLDELLVDAGDVVQKGQLLAQLDVPELQIDLSNAEAEQRRALAEEAQATAVYEDARLNLTRLEGADKAQPNLIARQDIDSARLKEQSAKAALNARVEARKAAETSAAKFQTMLAYTKITAPFAGVITRRYSDPGALIQAGTSTGSLPLVRLSQNDKLRATFPLSVSYVAAVKVGDEAEVRVPSMNKTLKGRVARLSQKVETATRTMEAQVDINNSDRSLIAGVYATVILKLDRKADALVLPVEAVAREKTGSTVYLVTKDRKLEARAVTIGTETATRLEIASGLSEGDLVMVGSRAQFSAGQSVNPQVVELPKLD
jgi:RND family efflux transporter MFP subunit